MTRRNLFQALAALACAPFVKALPASAKDHWWNPAGMLRFLTIDESRWTEPGIYFRNYTDQSFSVELDYAGTLELLARHGLKIEIRKSAEDSIRLAIKEVGKQ